MDLVIRKSVAEKIGLKAFKAYGFEVESWSWGSKTIDLAQLNKKKLGKLESFLRQHKSIHGVGVYLRDIETWRDALTSEKGDVKARTVRQFEPLLKKFLSDVSKHHLYERKSEEVWLPHYVSEIDYHEKVTHNHSTTPEHVSVTLLHSEFGGQHKKIVIFWEDDCRSVSMVEALARQNLFVTTDALRSRYEMELKLFTKYASGVGAQYYATGTGTDDVDGNPDSGSYWRNQHTFPLVRDGQPTRVVADVFFEDAAHKDTEREYVNRWFWRNFSPEEDDDAIEEDTEETIPDPEIPVHPFLAVFDMQKHLRLRVHVSYLTPYVYDKKLSDKLVLPEEMKSLVRLLIEHKDGGFTDIVKGKAGGAVVLLAGPPGVGKTLTAEVYAETEERALYSVQCSQLGTNPEDLETELLKVFARSRRWNAVMLLDEADVYVHERGGDLQQNAIVGVFLRVLEYQDAVLFLTTNRPDDVDDAIASRCVARLIYPVPTTDQQAQIWEILSKGAGAKISSKTIRGITTRNPGLTGRDVKNLLKLAMLMKGKSTKEILESDIEFVKQFQPTVRVTKT